jgi:MerR family transcriptional regulator, light-induced transcriptional regulator
MEDGTDRFQNTANAITRMRENLVRNAIDRQYASQPEVWQPYQYAGYLKSLRDAGFHFTYLSEAIANNQPAIFLDYVAWLKIFFAAKRFPPDTLNETLANMKLALQDLLGAQQATLAVEWIDSALEQIPGLPESIPSFLDPQELYFDLATIYLDELLQGDRRAASQLILKAVKNGVSIQDIYLHVFQNTQREVGRLWQINQISVAQEHFCTAATQMVISQLYPYIFTSRKNNRCLVATCVGDELHELGMRMVADFFEMGGWDTYFLGANTPAESVISAIVERKAKAVAISATLPVHLSKVSELIHRIRSNRQSSGVKILVGGYPFNLSRELWKTVGADGYAPDALQAIQVANNLTQGIAS